MKFARITRSIIAVGLFGLLLTLGCSSNNPVTPDNGDNDQDVSQAAKSASSSSVDIYRNMSAFQEIDDLISGPDQIADLEIPEVENPDNAMNFARSIQQKVIGRFRLAKRGVDIQSTNGDSVIWDVVFEENGITYRSKLIYDDTEGTAHLYLVGFEFPENHPLSYDSTDVRADLNSTLLNDSDDVLLSLNVLKRFKPGQLIQEERASFVPDPHDPGTEPTGGVLTNDITYSNSNFISSTSARFEYHEGEGGSYFKESTFSDGSTSREEATFNEDGTGTFSELRRDGTQIEGEFDTGQQDGQGNFSLTTTFPAGHDPVSISESGEFTIDGSDSTVQGSFEREVTFQDGRTKQESVSIDQTRVGDVLTTTLNVEKSDGSGGFITIVETDDVDQVSGEWTNADETFVVFSAESYTDNSAHLEFDVYESEVAFENGEEPIASGVFDFYPDGSGRGTVTDGETTYDVTIHPDGSETVEPQS